ncbi:pectate lyase [Phytophthora cinnamomi]|uniref:pectate lyase n=1 Tax=Phytophthora cinnamomi TaxID=4785 RepID=UPI00355A7DB4|nr:pectate lyase [Phytophthora cinnamomi]
MQTFERSDISCEGQTESGASTAVFKLEPGATLKNVIIGKNQMEGVHCDKHDCTIENVWWDDVCEDALSIKGGTASSVSNVIGGGARYADDKVIQHNGYGTVKIDGFYGEDISKLYRSCGTCGDKQRKVSVSNVYVVNPTNAIVTVNKNWNDEATLSNVWVKSSGTKAVKICQWSQGNADGEPSILGNGPSPPLCQYSEADVHINEDISQAAQTSTSSTSSSSADTTQTASSASASASTSVSASTSASSSQVPTQVSSSFADSSLASSASTAASSQTSSNSSTDASAESAPGTVAPVESGSFEQSVASSAGSQTEQQTSTEVPTALSSASSSSSGSLYSSSDDVTQTAVQQSSVASSSATDVSQLDVTLECDSSSSKASEQASQPSSVASSSAADPSQTSGGSSAGSSTEQVEVSSQQSASASADTSSASNSDVESQQETASANGSTTSSSAVAPTSSSTTTSSSSSSGTDSITQNSSAGSPTQSSNTGSHSQTSGSESTEQTSTNSTVGVPDGTWPASTGTVLYTKPYTIKAGEVFDGKMQTFERSDITCSDGEGQKDTAVFLVEAGGTLKNAIIGKNQKEGVHCDNHDCTIENVWWDDVCEDALSIKGGSASSVTTVTNCGARYASDKVVQHNGYGTVKINGFFAQEFGKLYRSCGTCGNIARTVTVENVYAIDPLVSVVTVNKNYNDQATLKNIYVKTTDGNDDVKVCQWSQGSKTPSNLGDGPSGTLCQYTESDIHINEE